MAIQSIAIGPVGDSFNSNRDAQKSTASTAQWIDGALGRLALLKERVSSFLFQTTSGCAALGAKATVATKMYRLRRQWSK